MTDVPERAGQSAAKDPAAMPARSAEAARPAAQAAGPARQAATASKALVVTEPAAKPTITELKDKIMATAKTTTDFTQPVADALGEIQTRAKAAYEKGTEAMTEVTEFTKGNVEAFVESGKILAGGVQDLSRTYVEEAKGAFETLTADVKEIAAVKSPTELFQLQSKMLRRNFDTLVATGSKNSEAVLKLASDAFAPLSGRVNVAAEKLSKVA